MAHAFSDSQLVKLLKMQAFLWDQLLNQLEDNESLIKLAQLFELDPLHQVPQFL
jgi:hypothetical protein